MDRFGLLPGIQLKSVYKASWVVCHGTDFRKSGVIVHKVDEDLLLPMFGIIKQIWNVSDFIYFEYIPLETMYFSECFQAYHVKETEAMETGIVSYENFVDYNVFHTHKDILQSWTKLLRKFRKTLILSTAYNNFYMAL